MGTVVCLLAPVEERDITEWLAFEGGYTVPMVCGLIGNDRPR